MNLTEWLVSNSIALVAAVIIGIVAYVKINADGREGREAKQALEEHRKSQNPHADCPIHATLLHEMSDKISQIDERVYAIWKSNGYNK